MSEIVETSDFFRGEKYFSFVCPENREGEARLLLGNITNVTVFDESPGITRVAPTEAGNFVEVSGIEISGQCVGEGCEEALNVLAAHQISGFSRETQVVFREQGEIISETILRITPGEL